MNNMKALVCKEPTILEFQMRKKPEVSLGQVTIKVKKVGICGTDIHAWAGHQPFFSYPRVLGHEICGTIVEKSPEISSFNVGQLVSVIPYIACNQCPSCKAGKPNCCENISVIGVHQDGGFCEYINVPVSNIIDATGVDPEAAALIEPFSISAHAVRRAEIKKDDQVIVIGAGPIGLGVAAIAKADGADVIVADVSESRRKHVENILKIKTINPQSEIESEIRDLFSGKLAQKVIDATGNKSSMDNAVKLIRNGGSITYVGLFKGDLNISDPEFHKKETTIMGSRNATKEDFEKVCLLMSQDKIRSDMMLSHRFDFSTLDSTYEKDVIKNKDLIKGVISFND